VARKPDDSTFSERLAYARWLRVVDETDKTLADRAGVGAPWLGKWKERPDAPPGRKDGPALAKALGVSTEWLLDNAGDPPEAPRWPGWLTKWRAGRQVTETQRSALPTNEELAAMTGARATKPQTTSIRELEREAEKAKAAKRGGRSA
jgi:transcriptional regulator with XRE-family HTH domain